MKYLCLIYDEEKTMAGMSKAEGDAFMGEYFAFTEGIKKSRPLRGRRGAEAGAHGHHRSHPRTARCRPPTARSPRRRSSSAGIT